MLDAVVDYLPAPTEVRAIAGMLEDGVTPAVRASSDDAPFAALVFKIAKDPSTGTLTFFRVYSGALHSGDVVYHVAKRKPERIGRMVQMHANDRSEIHEVRAGDIAAAVGLLDVATGDTLCALNHIITLERMDFPEPVMSVAVEPKSVRDRESLAAALAHMAEEDPSFRVHTDADSGQTIIEGMGELHLDVVAERLRREFKVAISVGKPRVAYRETIRAQVEIEGKLARQWGGRGQYAHVRLRLAPLAAGGAAYQFADQTTAGTIPPAFIGAVERGIGDQLRSGVLAGYPLTNIAVTLFDGSYHEVDSSEMAFRIAASTALKAGALKARPAVLEPIMAVEVATPEVYLGDVVGDFNRRRGLIQGIDAGSTGKIIRADVPMAEMFGYATHLRSATQGRATFAMKFSRYQVVPDGIAQGIIKQA